MQGLIEPGKEKLPPCNACGKDVDYAILNIRIEIGSDFDIPAHAEPSLVFVPCKHEVYAYNWSEQWYGKASEAIQWLAIRDQVDRETGGGQ